MKSHELAKLLLAQPDTDVAFLDEWGAQYVGELSLVKLTENGQECYSTDKIDIIRNHVNMYSEAKVRSDYNYYIARYSTTAEDASKLYGTYEEYRDMMQLQNVRRLSILKECDESKFVILIGAK